MNLPSHFDARVFELLSDGIESISKNVAFLRQLVQLSNHGDHFVMMFHVFDLSIILLKLVKWKWGKIGENRVLTVTSNWRCMAR
jgi:hypothetical protein